MEMQSCEAGERLRLRDSERRIEGQHARLEDIAQGVWETLDKGGAASAINDFLLYLAAMEAHMSLEEEVTFPRLHGLRPDLEIELTRLEQDHEDMREALGEIKRRLKCGDDAGARFAFEALARRLDRHEEIEEELLAHVSEAPTLASLA